MRDSLILWLKDIVVVFINIWKEKAEKKSSSSEHEVQNSSYTDLHRDSSVELRTRENEDGEKTVYHTMKMLSSSWIIALVSSGSCECAAAVGCAS